MIGNRFLVPQRRRDRAARWHGVRWFAERQRRLDDRRRGQMVDGLNLAVANAVGVVTAADERTEQTKVDEEQQSATHGFPTFRLYNRVILGGRPDRPGSR
jgi:hypothetical protein